MLVVELIIVLLAIFLGARLGGIGIGFAGGLGVLVLAAIGVKPGNIPFDVISIIMAVIAAISAMQVAGGKTGGLRDLDPRRYLSLLLGR